MAGKSVWFDLMTPEPLAAGAFYAALGFGVQPWEGPMNYTMFTSGAEAFGGVMELPKEALDHGAPPHWLGYVGVDDLDASLAKAAALGARVMRGAAEIPGTGRFAILTDPTGAVLALFQSANPGGADLKAVAWVELSSTDPARAMAFYADLFGWVPTEAMDLGPMGTYQMFGTAEHSFGGLQKSPPQLPASAWSYYFAVDAAQARVDAAKAAGATVLYGLQEVPGGHTAMLVDPQGAAFGIFSMSA
jgi:predicted enzyme related to lactoylglutathione lyase